VAISNRWSFVWQTLFDRKESVDGEMISLIDLFIGFIGKIVWAVG
jgi:hypothetical protein